MYERKQFIDAYLAEQGESLPDTAGELVTSNGEVIGTHLGIHNFTVGQRKGLGFAAGERNTYDVAFNADGGGRRRRRG